MSDTPTREEMLQKNYSPPSGKDWMDIPTEIRKGIALYAGNPKSLETVGFPNPRTWSCFDEDWQLPKKLVQFQSWLVLTPPLGPSKAK